ncbi:aprataxin and PNK-like factor [Eublepharis macularius]|uniref:Aprataxin and PNK-like factor n=1 Tax=Eublepharis macularius TaxID=481883 RepID=A0AA97LJ43_EUBMA|nr:aprataxin and PNK-like factor [Eublepharis macularius]
MSRFEVAPVDGGSAVVLPPGETVIGRGALLGITDKRVSRNHAILKVIGDQLCIKPVHLNPCFYWPSENSLPLPLDTGEWHQLSPGDNFSLLVDKYVFRVIFTHTEMEDLQSQNRGNLEAEEKPDDVLPRQSSLQQTSSSSHGKLPEDNSLLERTAEPVQKLCTSVAETEMRRLASRKRLLPAWMLQQDLVVPSSSSLDPGRGSNEEREKRPGKKPKMTESEDAALSVQDIQSVATESALPQMEKNDSKVVPELPKCSMMQNECSESSQTGLQAVERDTSNQREIKEENATPRTEEQGMPSQSPIHQDANEAFISDQTTETDISDLTGSSAVPQSTNVSKHKRIPCHYGRNCYRKNPVHFQQFSHPGDGDYLDPEVVTPADNDCRPECPYGTACYRKNPQHKIEYKHTAPPEPERRQTRPKPVKKGRSILGDDSDNDGEPNEYNLDDSFIDDEDEEECDPTDEDSDWKPDFEEKNDEDVDTLLKEAQMFVKTKK